MTLIAHAGDWIVSLIYIVPVVAIVAVLVITNIRDRRRGPPGYSTDQPNESEP